MNRTTCAESKNCSNVRFVEYFSDNQALNFHRRIDIQLRFNGNAGEQYAVDKWA